MTKRMHLVQTETNKQTNMQRKVGSKRVTNIVNRVCVNTSRCIADIIIKVINLQDSSLYR